jgi:signal peptidase I
MEKTYNHLKEPWLAVVLSSFLAGIGQIYAGRKWRGIILILTVAGLIGFSIWSILSPKCDILVSAGIYVAILIIWIWNLFDAHKCTRKANPEDFEAERKLSKDPWLALFLSDLIPGLGHLYIRRWLGGIRFMIIAVVLIIETHHHPLLQVFLWAVLSTFVCYRAYVMTPFHRQVSPKVLLIIFIAILCSHLLSCYKFIFEKYIAKTFVMQTDPRLADILPPNVSGTSMKPTLLPGDMFLVRKNKKYIPKLGDVIAFNSPDDPSIPWIMRVAALPGETIEIKDKILYINGQKVWLPALQNIKYPFRDYIGMEGKPYKVPENQIFVIGDNSANSYDSRDFGAIPLSDVIGKAYKIYWPLSRRGPIK